MSNDNYRSARPTNGEGLAEVELDQAHAPDKVMAHEDLLRKFVNTGVALPLSLVGLALASDPIQLAVALVI